MINDLLFKLLCFKHDVIYDLISYQDLKLCVDVGAAAGVITKKIKQAGTNETKVLAFEPFEGNHQYFLKNTATLKNVELIPKAVSVQSGTAKFQVPSVVAGTERGWEEMIGYSSAGSLVNDKAGAAQASASREFLVDTVAIDDIVHEHIDFLKVDVQGGELEVLKGCERVICDHGIDVMYVEFSGDERILEFLHAHHYSVFDTDYLIMARNDDPSLIQSSGFYDLNEVNLSNGHKAYHAKLRLVDQEYCSFLRDCRKSFGYVFTDLICVSDRFLDQFVVNLGDLLCETSAEGENKQVVLSMTTNRKLSAPVNKHIATSSLSLPMALSSQQNQTKLGTVELATDLLKRIGSYYSRWPIILAILAIFLNLAMLVSNSYRWFFACSTTVVLLLLIGHAASKADYVLAEVEQIKKSLQPMNTSKKSKRKKIGST
ncbi:FkbM family methyltransferase [Egbenema bharatensis]|uniref:FkbM family methyltransferase n=1 Tax=Egbenema bharatensis TaxID=3463334 RepID=UPI003A8498C1